MREPTVILCISAVSAVVILFRIFYVRLLDKMVSYVTMACIAADESLSIGLPPVQFLAGLYWNSIHCPGSREKGAWTLFCPALS